MPAPFFPVLSFDFKTLSEIEVMRHNLNGKVVVGKCIFFWIELSTKLCNLHYFVDFFGLFTAKLIRTLSFEGRRPFSCTEQRSDWGDWVMNFTNQFVNYMLIVLVSYFRFSSKRSKTSWSKLMWSCSSTRKLFYGWKEWKSAISLNHYMLTRFRTLL